MDNASKILNETFIYSSNFSSQNCKKEIDTILKEKLKLQGYSLDKMLISCTYDKKACSMNDFYSLKSRNFENCYSFNYGRNLAGNEIPIAKSKRAGFQNGLKLELFVGAPEYQPCWTDKYGVIVVVHNRSFTPVFIE